MRVSQSWEPVFVASGVGERLLAGFVRPAPIARLLHLAGNELWQAADVRRRPLVNIDGRARTFSSRAHAEEAVACMT